MSEGRTEHLSHPESGIANAEQDPSRALVFMGGLGYDERRNLEVGGAIMQLASGYSHTITVPDINPIGSKDGTVIHRYPDGSELELSGKESLKRLGSDEAEVRFSKLHEDRANRLIGAIESRGGRPVDAVFQSVDVSTGLLAVYRRPELFKRVVLLDPAGIIDLPPRREFLKQEWQNGNLIQVLNRKGDPVETIRFEASASWLQKMIRNKRSLRGGNRIASYVSSQAVMLHEIAESDYAPDLSIIASQFDHAYSPLKILQSLVNLNDINGFFVTNMRHGLGGKQVKLEQVVQVLKQTGDAAGSFVDRLHFFDGVADDYQRKILDTVLTRLKK